MKREEKIHPAIFDLKEEMEEGRLTRRGFLRFATLLGMSAAAASTLAGIPFPRKVAAATIKRGGVLKISQQIQKIKYQTLRKIL